MSNEPSNLGRKLEPNYHKIDFLSHLGVDVLSLLQARPGERILDIGCGNGDLTAKIAAAGAIPTGIDLSERMVKLANQKYPDLNVQVEDASQYRTDVAFDAVFSHAAIHWIHNPADVVQSIWQALREGGRFVAEFAGSGNIALLITAIKQALEVHGYTWAGRNPWYHPTIGEYTSLLEQRGFRVTFAQHFDNPTPLKGEATGLKNWLNSFSDYFFSDVISADKASIYQAIEAQVRPHFERENQWFLDTSRIRIVAIKERT
ncbi:methyltransferase domain-containing protein [Paenibacillus sp. JNUCC31]|uniref:class I SAM-dependent methyltransferase n=1 Tax=Paenibacillus sp. JNUCC-31 TaxID=2777983 RepID=UPI00177BF581|nr:class I SAM-dependent methyltransferase [Paenibacillus sp. JNUCC-31]QOS78893.1 methyltransferase domain-containing protein [Paenibacillus sp. JNUCC-31]